MPLIQTPQSRSLATLRSVGALMLREMATTYGRSPGGYFWAVIEPVAGIALLTFVFSLAFDAPPLGQSFPLFYASGFLPFMVYLNISNKLAVALRYSRPLLFYPAVRFIDPLLARLALNSLIEVTVGVVVISGIVWIFNVPWVAEWDHLIAAYALAVSLGFGVGTLNCVVMSMVPVWERIWAILNRPLFIISTVFFVFEAVPHPYQDLLWFNPLVHLVGSMRAGLFPGYDAAFVSPLYVGGIAGVSLVLGLLLLRRWYREIINN